MEFDNLSVGKKYGCVVGIKPNINSGYIQVESKNGDIIQGILLIRGLAASDINLYHVSINRQLAAYCPGYTFNGIQYSYCIAQLAGLYLLDNQN
uniref:Uncharacterized protein n=1 Tax=viral metagenome TaxID=1070528 RepID=A0A6C0JRW5_9ZZZZ